jgi:hypothetical protein
MIKRKMKSKERVCSISSQGNAQSERLGKPVADGKRGTEILVKRHISIMFPITT